MRPVERFAGDMHSDGDLWIKREWHSGRITTGRRRIARALLHDRGAEFACASANISARRRLYRAVTWISQTRIFARRRRPFSRIAECRIVRRQIGDDAFRRHERARCDGGVLQGKARHAQRIDHAGLE